MPALSDIEAAKRTPPPISEEDILALAEYWDEDDDLLGNIKAIRWWLGLPSDS